MDAPVCQSRPRLVYSGRADGYRPLIRRYLVIPAAAGQPSDIITAAGTMKLNSSHTG